MNTPGKARNCLSSVLLLIITSLPVSPLLAATYIVGGSSVVPANTYGNSYATIPLTSATTIRDITFTATFSPAIQPDGTVVPVVTGPTFLRLRVTGSSTAPGLNETRSGVIFDFPATYPVPNGQPACVSTGILDFTCIDSTLDGTYVFSSGGAVPQFETVAIATDTGISVASGTYTTRSGFLAALNGLSADRQFNIDVTTGTIYSGTYGTLDWEIQVTTVPLPTALWLFVSGLLALTNHCRMVGTSKRIRT